MSQQRFTISPTTTDKAHGWTINHPNGEVFKVLPASFSKQDATVLADQLSADRTTRIIFTDSGYGSL